MTNIKYYYVKQSWYAVPEPQSFGLKSSGGATVLNGSDVTIDCTIELGPTVMESELSLLMVETQLFMVRDGVTRNLSLTSQAISGTTFTYTTVVNSFSRSDSGNYSCEASIRPSSIYLYGDLELSHKISITTGNCDKMAILSLCYDCKLSLFLMTMT